MIKKNYVLKKEYFLKQHKQYYIANFEKNRDSKNEYNRQYRFKKNGLNYFHYMK